MIQRQYRGLLTDLHTVVQEIGKVRGWNLFTPLII